MKKKLSFELRVSVERETGRLLAAYLQVREGKADQVVEVAPGKAFANYRRGKLLGIELLGPCEIEVLDEIAREEPDEIREFFLRSPPRELVLA